MNSSDIPLPKDPRHQRFADLHVFGGRTATDAYREAGFKCTPKSAGANAHNLMRRADVKAYIAAVRAQAATDLTLTLKEKREFLARVVRTRIGALDPDGDTGDLIKTHTTQESEMGSSSRVEKIDPLKAIEIDNRLAEDCPQEDAFTALARALTGLASRSPLPSGKL